LAQRKAGGRNGQWFELSGFDELVIGGETGFAPRGPHLCQGKGGGLVSPRSGDVGQHVDDLRIVKDLRRHEVVVTLGGDFDRSGEPFTKSFDDLLPFAGQPFTAIQWRIYRRHSETVRLVAQGAFLDEDL